MQSSAQAFLAIAVLPPVQQQDSVKPSTGMFPFTHEHACASLGSCQR